MSPQLTTIFSTFEELLRNPDQCVSNMAHVARVLGERRICKLQVSSMMVGLQYTIYCAEHEMISSSIQVLAEVVSFCYMFNYVTCFSSMFFFFPFFSFSYPLLLLVGGQSFMGKIIIQWA